MKMRSGVLLVGASVVLSACGGGSSGDSTNTCVSGIPGLCSTLGVSTGNTGGTTNPSLYTTAPAQVSITPGTSAVYTIGGGNGPYTATSGNATVATASLTGNSLTVTGIASGTTNIAITDAAGGKVSIAVDTTSSQALFTTAPKQVSITPGTSGVYAIGGGTGPYSATSSNTSVAKVKVNGTVLTIDSITSGKATIAVTDSAGHSVAIDVAFDDPTWSAEPLFTTAPTDITLPYAGAVTYFIAGGVPPYTASTSNPTVVAASVNGTSLNLTTQWQQSATSTPAAVTVVDAKGHRVQTNVTVLGMGQSGSVPAILPASIIVSDCTTNIPFVFFGGTPPYTVYSSDSARVPVSAPLPFGPNSYFTASVHLATRPPIVGNDDFKFTLTVLDSQSKSATTELFVPLSSMMTCPNNPLLDVVAGSTVAKESERVSFQIKGGKPPYTITSVSYLPNNPRPTTDIVSIVEPLNKVVSTVDSNGDYSFVVMALSIASLPTPTGTAMITVTDADGQKKNVVLTVYPQPKP